MSIERPSTPSPASAAGGEGSQMSQTGVSFGYPQAMNKHVDPDFRTKYLPQPPSCSPKEADTLIQEIQAAGSVEKKIYSPCSKLLTLYSKYFYKILPIAVKNKLRLRHGVPSNEDAHITFIDHHLTAPTHFPDETLCYVNDAPDLLGVFNVEHFSESDGVYRGVPHHRVEVIVECKPEKNNQGRAGASAYAYRHQQARPDHPGMYCLIVKPEWYQVIFSSPAGVIASPETDWADGRILAAYVYAHYVPPRNCCLVDETLSWSAGEKPEDLPNWSIRFAGKDYTDGCFLFIGEPWGRRTTVFLVRDKNGDAVVIKELYRHVKRRFKEEEILEHIHKEGDVPGVVRLIGAEHVASGNRDILWDEEANSSRVKLRLAFSDYGERLLQAKSVNDLLEAIYDALEVHRMLLKQRKVIHRDMSIYNILMYPRWANLDRPVRKDAPPYIQDILGEYVRPLQERIPASLTIDVDNAAYLNDDPVNVEELMHRTGTPMYIARSVCAGQVLADRYAKDGTRMPVLKGKALESYIKAHGRERYDLYDEKSDKTCHGALPPNRDQDESTYPKFSHRPEHDAESTFWTSLSALLRVQPVASKREKYANEAVATVWEQLHRHSIPNNPTWDSEKRHIILMRIRSAWKSLFTDEMQDVAILMYDLAQQVSCEYALYTGDLEIDHLHEAMQRLILQYLVDHQDQPIPLDPEATRPTTAKANTELDEIPVQAGGTKDLSAEIAGVLGRDLRRAGNGSTRINTREGSTRQIAAAGSYRAGPSRGTRERRSANVRPPQPEAVAGLSTRSRGTRERRSANITPPAPDVMNGLKRRTESQGGRSSKRLKGLPPQEDDADA